MPEVPDTVDDAIEPLSSPSTDEVFEATRPFSAREIASAAASEALGAGGGGGGVLSASATLTNAQILALPSTPVDIVASPGAGKALYYIGGLVVLDNTAGVYGNVGAFGAAGVGNAAVLRVKNGTWQASILAAVDWALTDGSDKVAFSLGPYSDLFTSSGSPNPQHIIDGWSDYLPEIEDQPLVLICDNGAVTPIGDFTGGDSANTLVVTVLYVILDV